MRAITFTEYQNLWTIYFEVKTRFKAILGGLPAKLLGMTLATLVINRPNTSSTVTFPQKKVPSSGHRWLKNLLTTSLTRELGNSVGFCLNVEAHQLLQNSMTQNLKAQIIKSNINGHWSMAMDYDYRTILMARP